MQAWLIDLEDATLKVDTGSERQRRRSRIKVHRGFHTSWRLNGMREKVADLLRSEVCPDAAAARRMKVLFTGEGWLRSPSEHSLSATSPPASTKEGVADLL